MRLEMLQKDKIAAMKAKDDVKKSVLSEMIDAVQKASITPKGRIEITEDLVDASLIKYQKMTQEMIDTCPPTRPEKLAEYTANMEVVKQYAPQLVTDPEQIREMVLRILNDCGIAATKQNKGQVMKVVMPVFKGKVDSKTANQVIAEILV